MAKKKVDALFADPITGDDPILGSAGDEVSATENVTEQPDVTPTESVFTYILCDKFAPAVVNALAAQIVRPGVVLAFNREALLNSGEVILLGSSPEDVKWLAKNRPGITVTCLEGRTVEALSKLYARYGRELPALFANMPLIVAEARGNDDDGHTATSAA